MNDEFAKIGNQHTTSLPMLFGTDYYCSLRKATIQGVRAPPWRSTALAKFNDDNEFALGYEELCYLA